MFLTCFLFQASTKSTSPLISRLGLRSVDRAGRPTCTELCTLLAQWAGRPGRSTVPESSALCLLGSTVPVDRDESSALCMFGSTGPVDRDCPTVIFLTVGGRPGRSTDSLSGCHISLTASFLMGLYKPHLFGDFG